MLVFHRQQVVRRQEQTSPQSAQRLTENRHRDEPAAEEARTSLWFWLASAQTVVSRGTDIPEPRGRVFHVVTVRPDTEYGMVFNLLREFPFLGCGPFADPYRFTHTLLLCPLGELSKQPP